MIIPQPIDSMNIKKDLVKILDKYSSKSLTDTEIQSLKNRDKNVKHYLKLLNDFKSASSSNEDLFLSSVITFIGSALNMKEDELHQIMLIYFLLIASYITDFFNTQNLSEKKKHIKKMKKLFLDATLNIITTYELELLKTIENISLRDSKR